VGKRQRLPGRTGARAGGPEDKPVETKALAIGNGGETVVNEAGNVFKTQRD
jgi:hypothetical protein